MTTHSSPTATRDVADVVPIDDAATRATIQRLGEWLYAHGAKHGLRVESVRARRWQSIEDPDWIGVVVDIPGTGR